MSNLLWIIIIVLLIAWVTGAFVMHVGSLIHVLLVIALILVVYRLATGKRVV
jgi:hypothetical protein